MRLHCYREEAACKISGRCSSLHFHSEFCETRFLQKHHVEHKSSCRTGGFGPGPKDILADDKDFFWAKWAGVHTA